MKVNCPKCRSWHTRKATVYWQCMTCNNEWLEEVEMRALKGYIITILAPNVPEEESYDMEVKDILAGRVLGDVEDILNDALPEGYQAKIDEASLVR